MNGKIVTVSPNAPRLPSESSALRLVAGDMSAVPMALTSTAVRAAIIAAGLLAVGERKNVIRNAFAGATMIELTVLFWAAASQINPDR